MKWIKLFEEVEFLSPKVEKYWKEISEDEYDGLMFGDDAEVDDDSLENKEAFSSYEQEYLKKLGAHTWFNLDEFPDPWVTRQKLKDDEIKDPYQCSIDFHEADLMIEITKLKDDYFLVNYAVSENYPYGEGLFLCDQLEGLKKLLNDKARIEDLRKKVKSKVQTMSVEDLEKLSKWMNIE